MEARKDASAQQLLDDYVAANAEWINPKAEELLASLDLDLLWKIIDYGSLQFCRDPVAIIRIRIKDAERGKVCRCQLLCVFLMIVSAFGVILLEP